MSRITPNKKQTRKRKAELVAPQCRADCQINHTYEQVAAILNISVYQVERLVNAGRIRSIELGLGEVRKFRRIPHSAIQEILESAA
jgi:excisionase family DNA binding protein